MTCAGRWFSPGMTATLLASKRKLNAAAKWAIDVSNGPWSLISRQNCQTLSIIPFQLWQFVNSNGSCLAHLMQWTMWYVIVITTCSTSYSYGNIFFSEATVTKWGNFDRSHQNLLFWCKLAWPIRTSDKKGKRGNVLHSLTCEWYFYISYNVL